MKSMKKMLATCALLVMSCLQGMAYTQVERIDGPTWYEARSTGSSFQGEGTKTSPYKLASAADLAKLSYIVNEENNEFEGKYFALEADIDLGQEITVEGESQKLNWVPIGQLGAAPFKGTFLGKGHVIKGLTIRVSVAEYGEGAFGLFGWMEGNVEGVTLQNVNISGSSSAGTMMGGILGYKDQSGMVTIKDCKVDNAVIGGGRLGYAGGIAGWVRGCTFVGCVAKVTLKGNYCGGIVGMMDNAIGLSEAGLTTTMEDCHSVVDIQMEPESFSYNPFIAGGLCGHCKFAAKEVASNCSSSGHITSTDFQAASVYMGGLFGITSSGIVERCVSAVCIEKGKVEGGLIAMASHPLTMSDCFASGNIHITQDCTEVGGLIGDLRDQGNNLCDTYFTNCWFAGTFSGTENINPGSMKYGSVVGFCQPDQGLNENDAFNDVVVDKNMCNLPATSSGELEGIEWKATKDLVSDQEGYEYCYTLPRESMLLYASEHDGKEVSFKDNYILASVPFHVTEGKKSIAYSVHYITTPFSLAPLVSNATNHELATYTLPPSLSNVVYDENDNTLVYPIDPGEADLTVSCCGLTRKIHLNIAYGQEWNDNEVSEILAGDGTQDTPYMIQNASQLLTAIADTDRNREGVYFKLANDIFLNIHLLQTDETPRSDARQWTETAEWNAILDGGGHTIYGLYGRRGLFHMLYGHISDLAIVDSYVKSMIYLTTNSYGGLFCGKIYGAATIKRCLAHGYVYSFTAGGLVGANSGNQAIIEDCFSCVHVDSYATEGISSSSSGGGIMGGVAGTIRRCVSTSIVKNFGNPKGIGSAAHSEWPTCYYDLQMMNDAPMWSQRDRGDCSNTAEMTQGDLFGDVPAWQHEKGRYPMLRQFANTPYGDILSMPVFFAEDDYAGKVSQIFEFPTENVTWTAAGGDTYVDVINECGAASPMSATPSNQYEYIYATNNTVRSECTRALRIIAINTLPDGVVGIQFKDPKCKQSWLEVFKSSVGEVTLRNAATASVANFRSFRTKAKDAGVEFFPEMRFFAAITTLSEGMISGIDQLSEVQLPKQLKTINARAFNGCSALASIELPATLGRVAPGALDGSSLREITVNPHNEVFEVRSNALFTQGTADLVGYPPCRGENEVTISGPIGEIYSHAFYRIPQLEAVYIDNPKPDGTAAMLSDEECFVHEDEENGGMIDVYINDGTYDDTYTESNGGLYDGVLMKEYISQPLWRSYAQTGHLHRYFPLLVTAAKWATLYIGFSTQLPKGLKAYRVHKTSDYQFDETTTSVELKRMNNLLHYTTPVIIHAEQSGIYKLVPYEGSVPEALKYENWLQGTAIGADGRGGYSYGLSTSGQSTSNRGSILTLGYNSQGTLGFYYYNNPSEWIPPYKAYLPYNGNMDSSASAFTIYVNDEMDDDLTDGISNVRSHGTDGHQVYDLQGRRMNFDPRNPGDRQLPAGIYIIDGRKVVVK